MGAAVCYPVVLRRLDHQAIVWAYGSDKLDPL